jgi:uncharacterized protein with GYD domain
MRSVFLACYAPHAVKGLIGGSDREAAINALLDSVGGKLESLMFTRGEYDIAAIVEVPDQNTGVGLTMAIQASGAFTKITVLEALDMAPVLAAAQKAAKVYEPAG